MFQSTVQKSVLKNDSAGLRRSWTRRWMAPVLLAAALTIVGTMPRCYGSFALTRTLHDWVGTIENKWVRSLVFFLIAVWPVPIVYGICILADGIVINSIEFWSGENPMAHGRYNEDGEYRTSLRDGASRADFHYRDRGERLDITLSHPDAPTTSMVLLREMPGVIFVEKDGELVPMDVQPFEAGEVTALQVYSDGSPEATRLFPKADVDRMVDRLEMSAGTALNAQ